MRNAMEKEIKNERTKGSGRELAFTLMPLYALGVGVFAAYKFLKVSHKKSIKLLKLEGNVTVVFCGFFSSSNSEPMYITVQKPFLVWFDFECELQN